MADHGDIWVWTSTAGPSRTPLMSTAWLISYVGVALLYAAGATFGLVGLGRLVGWRGAAQVGPTAFAILFFVVLTQHPFPDPATLECPVRYTEPQLLPFEVVQRSRIAGLGLPARRGGCCALGLCRLS